MDKSLQRRHRVIAVLAAVAIAAAGIGIAVHFSSHSGSAPTVSTVSVKQKTYIFHDGDTLDSIVKVPKGTYLIVKSDQDDHDANVKVTSKGGFIVENGAVLALENVDFSGDGEKRSTPVFSVYGDMVMNDGAVSSFSSVSTGGSSDYGKGGVPAVSIVDGTFTMNDGEISGNSSTTTKKTAFGGAVRAEGKDAAIVINDGTISGNKVLSSAEVSENSTVTANALGGAIAVTEGASITINGGTISDNTAGSHAANKKNAYSNICSGNGGAIAVYSSDSSAISALYLEGGSITDNDAYRTGANKGTEAEADYETHGGGIFSNVYTKAVLTSGTITGNTSDDKGGGVFLDSGKAYGGASFKNTLVTNNEAETLGGGLWFCPNGEADMFSDVKADGIAVFDNETTTRGTDGAGDDLYVSPRSGSTGVTVTGTMPGGGSNAWYEDGGAATQKTSSQSSRYSSADAEKSGTLLQASAVVNKPSSSARTKATSSAKVVISGNSARYGGGVGSNHYLSFGTPTDDKDDDEPEPVESEKISINVNKVWVGDEGETVTVHLLANGRGIASAELTADANWSYTFTRLKKTDSNGKTIKYTLREDAVDGYESKITGNAKNGFTVTNTKKISVPVTKKWVGDEGTSATVHLLANGTEAASATLTADNDWTYTFTDLDQADSSGKITYTLTEDAVDGYESNITGDAESGFTVTNTKKISIPVTKVWSGGTGTSATVHLLANGTEVANATLTADNSWTYTFTDLDQADSDGNIAYTVTEDPVAGYTSSITGDAENGFTVTNTKETISIPVTKEWVGGEGDSATVHLLANGTEVASKTLTADDNWSYTFTGVDKTDDNGNAITYTLTEDTVDGYTSEVTGNASSGFTVTNTKEIEKIDIPVTKRWINDNGSAPEGAEATVHLLANGTEVTSTTLSAENNWTNTFTGLDKKDSSGNEIDYTLTEDPIDGYISNVSGNAESGFTVTNIQTVKVTVTKTINGGTTVPSSITVGIYNIEDESQSVATLNITALGGWVGTTDVPKYDLSGALITYTVKEEAVYDQNGKDETIFWIPTVYSNTEDPYSFNIENRPYGSG